MEHGFYHLDRGYWQTNDDVSQDILDSYPEGTIEISLKPVGNFDWDGTEWVEISTDLEELSARYRGLRNSLLAQSDWTQVADAPVDQTAWANYRQKLRDITTQAEFPENISWPVAP